MNAPAFPPPAEALLSLPPILKAADVAGLLRMAVQNFYNRRHALEANGFPKKLPGMNAWSRAAVLRWIETNGQTFQPAEPAARANTLEERYS